MISFGEDLEGLLDDFESDDAESRGGRRSPVRTPSRQSSFAPRPTGQAASQTQVQSAARNLDAKIETLSNAVKALETRVNGVAADTQRVGTVVKKEIEERKKSGDAIRGDLQQTKLLGAILPMIGQKTVDVTVLNAQGEPTGTTQKLLAPSDNPIAQFLPILLLLGGSSSGDGSKSGGLGDGILPLLLVVSLMNANK